MEHRKKTCSAFLGTTNCRSKNHGEFSGGANYHLKMRDKLSHTVNYHSKSQAERNNRRHDNAGKFPRKIVASEISLKSQEKPGISSKFIYVTFAQYCIDVMMIVVTIVHVVSVFKSSKRV